MRILAFSASIARYHATYGALGVDVADIRGDTWAALDIVEGELADAWVQLEEE